MVTDGGMWTGLESGVRGHHLQTFNLLENQKQRIEMRRKIACMERGEVA
jgi:hypothetical protein